MILNRHWKTLAAVLLLVLAFGHAQTSKMPAAVIVLGPGGFEPATTTIRTGNVLLLVQNRSGQKQVVLSLKDASGKSVHDVPVIASRYEWQEVVTLTPGQYTLTEASHSKWVCQITIK